MRTLYDSTNAADVPPGSELVAGYVDGSSAWSAADWQRFPGRKLVRVCIFNNRFDAAVIDVESGNNDATGAVPWIAGKWSRGETPTVYCFSDEGPAGYRISDVRAACRVAAVKLPLFWIAKWDGIAELYPSDPSIVAKQYANPTLTGGHYDASIVADTWPGIDKEAVVNTAPVYAGQSVADVNIKVGEVAMVSGIWTYQGKGNRTIAAKVYGTTPGIFPLTLYPPADPDADPTLVLNTQPALFIIAIRPS